MYQKRKEHMIKQLEREVMILHNKARFIEEQCEDIIDLRKKKKAQVIAMLETRQYDVIDEDEDFKYLRSMRIEQVEEENIKKLRDERDSKIKELELLKKTTPETMWNTELDTLVTQYKSYTKNRANRMKGVKSKLKVKKKKGKAKIKK
jgi:DNA topoisomerase-2